MKTAILVKNNDVASYPADILIDGEVKKSYNLEFELNALGVNMLIAKNLPSEIIKKLRDSGIIFFKINSLDELEGLDLDISFPKEFKNKRGWKCAKKGF
ncbi:MAG: hypothetical protein GXO01_04645 [Epsilonproteobacteria bacterium]|nr:hypothetical protein [Campylobacterota bacterium]